MGHSAEAHRVFFGHGRLDFPVNDVAAVAVENRRKVEEPAGDMNLGDIDVPVLMSTIRWDKTGA